MLHANAHPIRKNAGRLILLIDYMRSGLPNLKLLFSNPHHDVLTIRSSNQLSRSQKFTSTSNDAQDDGVFSRLYGRRHPCGDQVLMTSL